MAPDGTTEAPSHVTNFGRGIASEPGDALLLRQRGTLATTFRSLRHRNYRLYFFGQLVSLVGTWMQQTALVWLAFKVTGQSKWPALVSVAQIFPTFLLGAWAGALADRVPKRTLIIATQSGFLLQALVLALLAYAGILGPWEMVMLSILGGVIQAVDLPARLAFVMDMAGREDLINAVALNSLLFNVARVVGPACAAWMLIWLAPWTCFLLNALSYVAVIWALASMDISGSVRAASVPRGRQSLLDGFHYLIGHRDLAFLILLAGTTSLCGWPFTSLLPALTDHQLHAQESGYSLLVSATGVGAFMAAWALATFGSVRRPGLLIGLGVGMLILGLLGLALAQDFTLAILCCGAIGFGLILFLATSQTVLQLRSEEYNRGRIMGIWAMTMSGAVPLGNLIAGPAADRWGEPIILQVLGITCALSALGLLVLLRPGKLTVRREAAALATPEPEEVAAQGIVEQT
jgi:MFS family permease